MRSVPRRLRVPGASPVMAAFWTSRVCAPWRRCIFQTKAGRRCLNLGSGIYGGTQRQILGIKGNASPPLITTALGIALVMTAVCVLSHRWLGRLTATRHAEPDPRWTATLTTFAGLLLGVFVTLSSVGAGAIGMTALVVLYPRTPIARLVGSDIAHAINPEGSSALSERRQQTAFL